MLRASPPDDGADADGRFDVDSVLVTEFLLSFVGTLAGLKLSSDIAACIHTAQAFGAFSAKAGFKEDMNRFRPPPQRVLAALRLQDCFNAFKSPQRRSFEQPIGWTACRTS